MQGRCTKLWFVNIHYADDTIMHKDTKLNFCIDNDVTRERTEAGNGMISLENGDGKGLILQLLTNLFDPMVDWKDGKNKMEHLFFNAKGKPIKYTGYIVGEFDVGGDRRLMLGLGITPRLISREQQREERTDIVVDYIQFVREYSIKDQFDIFELPLINETKEEAISLSDFKKMVDKEYKDEIELFNVNNRSSYTQLLHSYGYTTSAIANMKQINQKEGSVETYFSSAMTNEGLFFNKIIPSINDELQNTDSSKETSDLVTAFLDTVKIAKDLPELRKVSESAEAIKEMLHPISEVLKKGMGMEEEKNLLRKKGYAIKEKLADVLHLKKRETGMIINQITNENEMASKIDYEIDNVEYSRTNSEKISIEKQVNELEDEIKGKTRFSNDIKSLLNIETINKNLKLFDFYQNQIDMKLELKAELEESLEHKELVAKIKDLRNAVQNRWEKHIFPHWKNVLASGEHFILKSEEEVSGLKREEGDFIQQRADMNSNKRILKESIDNHKINQDSVAKKHGEKVRFDLDGVIKQTKHLISNSIEEKNKKLIQLQIARDDHTEAIGTGKLLEDRKNNKAKELDDLEEVIKSALDVEKLLDESLSDYLKENDGEKRTRSWFLDKQTRMINRINSFDDKLSMNKRKLWDMEGDRELLEESKDFDVWIPNRDVLSFKKKLAEQGINCMLGSELLSTRSHAERKNELLKNPLLPYSVILFQEECSKIDFSLLQDEINRSMVSILIRQDMKNDGVEEDSFLKDLYKITNSGYVLKGKGYEFIENEETWEYWKLEIEQSAAEVEKNIKELTQLIEEGKWIVDRLAHHLIGKVSEELLTEKEELKNLLVVLVTDLENNNTKITTLQKDINLISTEVDNFTNIISKENDNLRDLLTWKDECDVNQRNILTLQEVDSEIKKLTKILESKRSEIDEKTNQPKMFENTMRRWENEARDYLKRLQVPVVSAVYPNIGTEDILAAPAEKPSLSEVLDLQSEVLLEKYRELTAKEGSSNIRIELLNSEIVSLTHSKNTHVFWLNQNAGDWEGTPAPNDTVEEIEEKERQFDLKIKTTELEIQDLRVQQAGVSTDLKHALNKLKMQRNAILEKHRKEPVYISGIDYGVERANLTDQKLESLDKLLELNNSLDTVKELIGHIDFLTETLLLDSHIEISSYTLNEVENIMAESDPRKLVNDWNRYRVRINDELDRFKRGMEKEYNRLLIEIETKESISNFVKEPFKNIILEIQSSQFRKAVTNIESIIFWAEKEVEKRAESKKQCDEAIRFFTERCTKRAQDVITSLKVFVNKMKVKNIDGDFVEMVRFERSYKFPDNKEDIHLLIKEYCENTIARLVVKFPNAENIKNKDVEPLVNISQIMKVVLGKFPKLYIYIPDGMGSLLTEKPKEHLYKEWEVINNGGDRSSSKSGGQTIMAHMILISMLQKKANDDNWTMIVTDNLFGAMSAKKLVQPVLAALEMLKVQWITVVPANAPVQITSNFNVVYLLSVDYKRGKGVITSKMEQYERRYLQHLRIVDGLRKRIEKEESI